MQIITSADFEAEVLKSKTPVLVDFYADWCGPCKQIAPALEQLAKEKAGSIKIVKVNVDASPDLAAKYSVRSIPNLVIIRNGDVIAHKAGGAPKSALARFIDDAVALPAANKLDLAPKAVTLSRQDKQRLREAFQAALDASPVSDATIRKTVQADIDSGKIFKHAEAFLSTGATLDDVVKQFRNTQFGPRPQ